MKRVAYRHKRNRTLFDYCEICAVWFTLKFRTLLKKHQKCAVSSAFDSRTLGERARWCGGAVVGRDALRRVRHSSLVTRPTGRDGARPSLFPFPVPHSPFPILHSSLSLPRVTLHSSRVTPSSLFPLPSSLFPRTLAPSHPIFPLTFAEIMWFNIRKKCGEKDAFHPSIERLALFQVGFR